MNNAVVSANGPTFDVVEYFEGHTRASGWFSDRFGNVKRHFCGDFFGERDGNRLNLKEQLYFSDGVNERREFSLQVNSDGRYCAESDAFIGVAKGNQARNGLRSQYIMKVMVGEGKYWNLGMDDYMFYQPDYSLHNSVEVTKWGIKIGTVVSQYFKHDGSELCATLMKKNVLAAVAMNKVANM